MHVTDAPTVSLPISWARNGEDVVLWRALGDLDAGRFLEFGDPADGDPTALRSLTERGWSGSVGPVDELADQRALDQRRAALGDGPLHAVLVAVDLPPTDTGPVRRLAELDPWVLVVGIAPDADAEPMKRELAAIGYRCTLYDGVSAYFVAAGHDHDLGVTLSYPACARDGYLPATAARLIEDARQRESRALESALRWRAKAVQSWADNSTRGVADRAELLKLREHADDLLNQLGLLQQTVSWRVTAPLRSVRRLRRGGAR